MADRPPPPIPASCGDRPTTPDGLVVPFGNVVLHDGGVDFRTHHNSRWAQCWHQGLCQVCGRPIPPPLVFLCGPNQLRKLLFDEPAVHPECAQYVARACPMVAGERAHFARGPVLADRGRGKKCYDPDCDCGGWVPTPGLSNRDGAGDAAVPYFAVYATAFALAAVPAPDEPGGYQVTGGVCLPADVVRVRRVSEPGRVYRPWLTVPREEWLAGYQPPPLAADELNAGGHRG